MRNVDELVRLCEKKYFQPYTRPAQQSDQTFFSSNSNSQSEASETPDNGISEENLDDYFYKAMMAKKSAADIRYFTFKSSDPREKFTISIHSPSEGEEEEEERETETYEWAERKREQRRKTTKKKTTRKHQWDYDFEISDSVPMDERLEDMINEENCVRRQKELTKQEIDRTNRKMRETPKPISTTALSFTWKLMDSHFKRENFLSLVSKAKYIEEHASFEGTASDLSEEDLLADQPMFNCLIRDVFVRKESMSVYETYFYMFCTPQWFLVPTTCKLTNKIPFGNFVLNMFKQHFHFFNHDVALRQSDGNETGAEESDSKSDKEGGITTLKAVCLLCANGEIFRDFDVVKDVRESNLKKTFVVLNEVSADTERLIASFIDKMYSAAFYSLYLTCANEHFKRHKTPFKEALNELPLGDTAKARCAIGVQFLSNLNSEMFVKTPKLATALDKSSLFFDHSNSRWYWTNGREVYYSGCLVRLMRAFARDVLT